MAAANEIDEDVDYSKNLLALGPDAWDDSALIEAFNRDIHFYKQSHQHQMIDLSKVSNMINFKKAKKLINITSNMSMSHSILPINNNPCTIHCYDDCDYLHRINQNVTNNDPEETGYEDQDEDDDESQYEEQEEEEESKEDEILAPSFVPFANKNKNKTKNKNIIYCQNNTNKINKYSSWPPQQSETQDQPQNDRNLNSNNKRKKRKQKQRKNKHKKEDNTNHIDTENLAELYRLQQQEQETAKPTEYAPNDHPQQPQSPQYQYQQYPQSAQNYYNPYYAQQSQSYYYPQPQPPPQMAMPQAPPHPQMPAMPPYGRSAMFNMGLNMMSPPTMSNKPSRDEALANMLLAWYWNGYYSGYQAAMENRK